MTGFRGAIFDVDGALLDSSHGRSWRGGSKALMENEWADIQALTAYSPEAFTPQVYQSVMNGKLRQADTQDELEYFEVLDTEERARKCGDSKQKGIEELIEASQFYAYPDALRFILAKAAGLKIAASYSKNTNAFLERVPLDKFVEEEGLEYGFVESGYTLLGIPDASVSGGDFEQGKPRPMIFLTADEELGAGSEKSFVIEDLARGRLKRAAGVR